MQVIELGEGVWGDARGWGLDPYRTSGIVPGGNVSCHVVSMNPGAVRGNHLHPDALEWMIVFGAPCTVAGRLPGEPPVELRVSGDDPVMLRFEAGEVHAVRGEGPGVTFLVAFNDQPSPVTERVEPILHGTI